MAKIRQKLQTFYVADTTDCQVSLPEHQTNDLLLIFLGKDDAVGGVLSTPAGWTKGGEGLVGASGANTVRSAWYYKIASSANEAFPTVTSTDPDSWSALAISVFGVNTGSPIDVSNGNGVTDVAGAPYTAASVTTVNANALVFYSCFADGGVSPCADPGVTMVDVVDTSFDALGVAFKVKRTPGATGVCDFICSGTADESVLFTVAIRDGSAGAILPAYPNSAVATVVNPLKGANLVRSGDLLDTTLITEGYTKLDGTWDNPTLVYQVDISPLTYVDITVAATNAIDADTVPFPAAEAVGDYLAIRAATQFKSIRFDRLSCTNGVAGIVIWEYLTAGAVWKPFADACNGVTSFTLAVADHQIVSWTTPTDWTSQALNGQSGFWARARITTIYSTNPSISQIFTSTSQTLYADVLTGLADTGTIPLFDSTQVTPGFSGNQLQGSCYNMSATQNLTGSDIILGTYIFATPRDYVDMGYIADGGVTVGFLDNVSALKTWVVGGSESLDTYADKRNIFAIQPGQTVATHSKTTSPNLASTKKILLATNSRYGPCVVAFNQLIKVSTLIISGGGTTTPVTFADLISAANGYPVPMIDRISKVAYVPVQFGGADAIYAIIKGFTLEFPAQSTAANKTTGFHVDNNTVGVLIDGRAGDTIKLLSGKFTGTSPFLFSILASASASAAYDFTGLVVEGATVTLRPVTTFANMVFNNCPSFTHNASLMNSCDINGTSIVTANPAVITNCSFTFDTAGHGMQITAPGTYTLSGNEFQGYTGTAGSNLVPNSGSTNAAIFNSSGGNVIINVTGSGNLMSVRNSAGSTTTVNQSFTLSLTGIVNDSEVRIYQSGTTTELSGQESVTTGTFNFGHSIAGTSIDIVVFHELYTFNEPESRIKNYVLPSADASIPISQKFDRNYVNP